MKHLIHKLCFLSAISLASIALAGPPIDVTVSNAAGKLVYKGKTAPNGTFATGKMAPGNYTVQFNGNNVKGSYTIVVSAGSKKVSADAVAGEKFARGGVAMKVEAGSGANISGQVSQGNVATRGSSSSGNGKTKIENGHRYFWVQSETGSNIGGHWVEEGSAEARNMTSMGASDVQDMQNRGMQGAAPGR